MNSICTAIPCQKFGCRHSGEENLPDTIWGRNLWQKLDSKQNLSSWCPWMSPGQPLWLQQQLLVTNLQYPGKNTFCPIFTCIWTLFGPTISRSTFFYRTFAWSHTCRGILHVRSLNIMNTENVETESATFFFFFLPGRKSILVRLEMHVRYYRTGRN